MPPVNPDRLPALMQEAQQLLAKGQFVQARQRLETVLATKPDIAVAHFNLAKVLLKLAEPDRALRHLDYAADLKPDEAAIWKQYATVLQWKADPQRSTAFLEKAKRARLDRNLLISLQDMLKAKPSKSKAAIGSVPPTELQRAISYLNEGRAAAAAKLAAQLDRSHPDVAIVVDLLAYAQAELGRAEDAEKNFRRAIAIDSKYAETRANFGQFLLRQGRHDEAVEVTKGALGMNPDMPAALTTLGTALNRKSLQSAAIPFLRRALVLAPESLPAKIELAECLLATYKPAEALDLMAPLTDVPMRNAKTRVLTAKALQDLQRYDEAEAEFDAAIDTASVKTIAMTGKATLLQTLGRFDEAETLLRKALKSEPLEGKIYHQLVTTRKISDTDPLIAEMEKLYQNPELTNESRMYLGFALSKALEDARQFDRVFTYLRPANDEMRYLYPYDVSQHQHATRFLLNAFQDADFATPIDGAGDFAPIFVTGLPRSGTTLVEQIVASHSQVTGGGELGIAHEALNEVRVEMKKRGQTAWTIADDQLAEIGREVETRMQDAFPFADRLTDKGVLTYEMIGPVRKMFPNSRIVVVRRDPRDTLLSMYKNVFREGRHRYTNNLRDLAAYYHCFEEVIDFWHKKLPGSFHEIEYEALIADPEAQAKALVAACDLEWQDQCLAFYENKRQVQTLSVHQVRQPLYSSSMKAWQRYEDDLAELFEALGAPWLPDAADRGA